jgi:hypothetical protein
MLIQRTQPTIITKVRAHTNIAGNEYTDKLAKDGNKLPDKSPIHPYERAHPTPYYFHRDNWPSMDQTPDKEPIRHLQPCLQKYEKEHSLKDIAQKFPNINKWTSDTNIDNETSNSFWSHPDITDPQITCILKFRYNQYMGNVRKQLFFGPTLHPNITCTICNSPELDTWKHVLLSSTQ